MKKILFRKLFYDFFTFFLIVSFSLSLIIWIIQSVNYLDLISKDGHGFKVYFSFISLNFPKIFSDITIFCYFISIFYIFQKYQANNEILIFWINGISKLKIVNFIFKISIIFSIIQIVFVYFYLPKIQDYSRDFIRTSKIDFFSSLISEKKFIDTVKDFTIYVDEIDELGNFKNIFLKDAINENNTQIITAKSGNIYDDGNSKYLILNFGQILDINSNKLSDAKLIKFTNTSFNISRFKTKTTIFPKIQELKSGILLDCIKNFLIGTKQKYNLQVFECSKNSSIKSAKEIFDRSIKQIYLITIGLIASLILFTNSKDSKYLYFKSLIFILGLIIIVFSEINSEYLSFSMITNSIIIITPFITIIFSYLGIFKLIYRNL